MQFFQRLGDFVWEFLFEELNGFDLDNDLIENTETLC